MSMTIEGDFLGIRPAGNGGEDLMAVRPGTIHSLDDVIAWIYTHDGKIEAWWSAQREWNVRQDTSANVCQQLMRNELKEMRREVQAIKSRIFYSMGFASALGAVIAMFAEHVLTK